MEADKTGSSRKWKKLDKAIYAVGDDKIIYFRIMVDGKRQTKRSPLQGAAAIGANGKPTNELKKLALSWRMELMNRDYYDQQERKQRVPSFAKLLELYQDASDAERIKSGSPSERTSQTAIKYFKYLVDACGFKWTEPMSRMKTENIDKCIVEWIKGGKKPVSAWSYACSSQSVTAKWAMDYYSREGYDVRPYQMPIFKNRKPERYKRPSAETLNAVKDWYKSLWHEDMTEMDYRSWFFVTMMLKFAMRNGDTGRITPGNFRDHDGTTYLCYTPHKTANRSGTMVNWPLHPDLYERIREAAKAIEIDEDGLFVNSSIEMSNRINRRLREAVPGLGESEKACYELRKICIDEIYHDFGVEMAAAISGDDIKTLTYFYADVSHVKASPALVAGQI